MSSNDYFEIVLYPDDRLKTVCEKVDTIDDNLRAIFDKMLRTMKANQGVGLAAPQIGILKRFVVVAVPKQPVLKMVNPEITYYSNDKIKYNEGCLSLPNLFENVIRSNEVTVKYTDENGILQEQTATGLLAVCIQHELDHLDGKMLLDNLSPFKRILALKRYKGK